MGLASDYQNYLASLQQGIGGWTDMSATTSALGSALIGQGIYSYGNQLTNQHQQQYQKIVVFQNIGPEIPKTKGSILHELRREIDEWHGDILRAA